MNLYVVMPLVPLFGGVRTLLVGQCIYIFREVNLEIDHGGANMAQIQLPLTRDIRWLIKPMYNDFPSGVPRPLALPKFTPMYILQICCHK